MPAPIGADAVIPSPARFQRLRVARLRRRAGVEVQGRVVLGRGARVNVAPGARVVLGDDCYLGPGARLEAVAGVLALGARTLVGERAILVSMAGLSTGEDCVIGAYAAVTPGAPLRREPVRLGDRVRLGAHAAVEPGADIPDGTVVGSYVVVAAEEVRSA